MGITAALVGGSIATGLLSKGKKTSESTTTPSNKIVRRPQRRLRLSTGRSSGFVDPAGALGFPGGIPTGQSTADELVGTQGAPVPGGVRPDTGIDARFNLDPRIRQLTEFSNTAAAQGLNRSRATIGRLQGSNNAFIRARVNPLIAERDRFNQKTQEDFARRGLFGSITNQQLKSNNLDFNRNIADQRALATREAENQILATEAQARGFGDDLARGSQMILAQELAALGISDQMIARMLQDEAIIEEGGGTSTTTKQKPKDFLGTTGKFLTAGSDIAGLFAGGSAV